MENRRSDGAKARRLRSANADAVHVDGWSIDEAIEPADNGGQHHETDQREQSVGTKRFRQHANRRRFADARQRAECSRGPWPPRSLGTDVGEHEKTPLSPCQQGNNGVACVTGIAPLHATPGSAGGSIMRDDVCRNGKRPPRAEPGAAATLARSRRGSSAPQRWPTTPSSAVSTKPVREPHRSAAFLSRTGVANQGNRRRRRGRRG